MHAAWRRGVNEWVRAEGADLRGVGHRVKDEGHVMCVVCVHCDHVQLILHACTVCDYMTWRLGCVCH